jgi:diacylglycerol kinase family enzyme
LILAPALRRGAHQPLPDVLSRHGGSIDIETDRPMRVNVDGEMVETTPARFGILPRALAVFAP